MDQPVLVVDLDGTLIHTDMLHESALKLFRDRPLDTLRIPLWLSRGKAVLKEQLASRTHVDPKTLPYNTALLSWLKSQKSEGRRLVLCTASDRSIADGIARHLELFDEVMASDGTLNLAGPQKAQALVARFGDKGFDYAGNSEADLAVWIADPGEEERRHRAIARDGQTYAPHWQRWADQDLGRSID